MSGPRARRVCTLRSRHRPGGRGPPSRRSSVLTSAAGTYKFSRSAPQAAASGSAHRGLRSTASGHSQDFVSTAICGLRPAGLSRSGLLVDGQQVHRPLQIRHAGAPRTAFPSGRAGAMTDGRPVKKRPAGRSPFAGIARIRSWGRRSACQLSGLSAFPPGLRVSPALRSVQLPRSPRRRYSRCMAPMTGA